MNVAYLNGIKCENLKIISLYNPSFLYGINVFEGIRAYWNESIQKMLFFDLEEHLDRLFISAKFMGFVLKIDKSKLKKELISIIENEKITENIYVRTTFFIGNDTTWSEQNEIHHLISMRSMESNIGNYSPTTLAFSVFERINSKSMPPFIKAGANYLNSRYALLETKRKGYEGAIFISEKGCISESTGSCIFFIKNGCVYTPSIDCDILVGITRNRIIELCKINDIKVVEEHISPAAIYNFDAAFLAGTMIEIKPISKIEAMEYNSTNNQVYITISNLLKKYIYGEEV